MGKNKYSGGVFLLRFMYGFELPRGARIGENVKFNHRGMGTVISSNSVIGNNTLLEHHVTLGIRHSGDRINIGSNCYIGAYALIIGNVTIGDNCRIGAGTLVLEDVPSGCTIINPCEVRLIKYKDVESQKMKNNQI